MVASKMGKVRVRAARNPPAGLKNLLPMRSDEVILPMMPKYWTMVKRLRKVTEIRSQRTTLSMIPRLFWDEVVVRKIIKSEMKKAVWPKRLTCLTGLSQKEEII